MVLACAAGCAVSRAPEPTTSKVEPPADAAPTESAPAPSAPSISAPVVVASTAPPPAPLAAPTPCNEISLGPCKVNYSARRTCLVAEGYFAIDATAETPSQREKFYACLKKVLTLPMGPAECTDAGSKCADAVSDNWSGKGSADSLPTLCAVPPKCATVLDASCGSAKKIIDDCYYAARKLKKP